MHIGYIEFYNPYKQKGGGPTTNRKILDAARLRGHQITVVAHDNITDLPDILDTADCILMCDVFNEPDHTYTFPEFVFREIIKSGIPYFKMDNSYVDVCRAPYGRVLWDKSCKDDFHKKDIVKDIYINAIARIFVSPLHQRSVLSLLPPWLSEDTNLVVSIPLEPIFCSREDINDERSISMLYVGTVNSPKGWYSIKPILDAEKSPLVIGPWRVPDNPPSYWRPFAPRETLPDIYRSAEVAIHYPVWPEPSSLFIREAQACGCRIESNGNVGCLSYDGNELGPNKLWKKLETLV